MGEVNLKSRISKELGEEFSGFTLYDNAKS
jgi:hypothetical protein